MVIVSIYLSVILNLYSHYFHEKLRALHILCHLTVSVDIRGSLKLYVTNLCRSWYVDYMPGIVKYSSLFSVLLRTIDMIFVYDDSVLNTMKKQMQKAANTILLRNITISTNDILISWYDCGSSEAVDYVVLSRYAILFWPECPAGASPAVQRGETLRYRLRRKYGGNGWPSYSAIPPWLPAILGVVPVASAVTVYRLAALVSPRNAVCHQAVALMKRIANAAGYLLYRRRLAAKRLMRLAYFGRGVPPWLCVAYSWPDRRSYQYQINLLSKYSIIICNKLLILWLSVTIWYLWL